MLTWDQLLGFYTVYASYTERVIIASLNYLSNISE